MDLITRRNPVLEALRANRREFAALFIQKGLPKKQIKPILAAAQAANVKIVERDKGALGNLVQSGDHQGVILQAGSYPYVEIDDILERAQSAGEAPLILILDLVQGLYNVGTLLRTAEIVGVHGVVVQERRAPDITPQVVQHAQGATEHLLVARVTNIVQAMEQLKAADIWIVGLDFGEDAYTLGSIDLNRSLALVVGHEGEGIRRLVRNSCDFLLELPQRGHVQSLNAAVAGSVALYAAWQARSS